jgi:phenylalanyl-tRNA synthetase alpha subunit
MSVSNYIVCFPVSPAHPDLIGTIYDFFTRIGIDDVRFKPAYNPYTEPSMEIFGYSKQLDKWCVSVCESECV